MLAAEQAPGPLADDPPFPRRVLVVGGGIAGLAAARELRHQFRVTVVDPKEFFEFTPGIMRAYSDPAHWDSLTFLYKDVLERNFGVGFIWGEVTAIDAEQRCAHVKTMFGQDEDVVKFDFCVIAIGCSFNQLSKTGDSPWLPTVQKKLREESEVRHLDERFLEGRRRRIIEEHQELELLNEQDADVLIVGAGPLGAEWACELQHFFPRLRITVAEFLPRCLGPLPDDAANYCQQFMEKRGITTVYGVKYDPKSTSFWAKVGLPNKCAKTYILSGVKHTNFFMPKNTLSDKGPGGGGWILHNDKLQVVDKDQEVWGDGKIFAVGDCIYGCVGHSPDWIIYPMPKTGYPAEHQAIHACRNLRALDNSWYGGQPRLRCWDLTRCCRPTQLRPTWYPWGGGIFSISLGTSDGCLIVGVDALEKKKGSGRLHARGSVAAAHKELIESTKIAQCRGDHVLASMLWKLIHHWPVNCLGRGPLCSCC